MICFPITCFDNITGSHVLFPSLIVQDEEKTENHTTDSDMNFQSEFPSFPSQTLSACHRLSQTVGDYYSFKLKPDLNLHRVPSLLPFYFTSHALLPKVRSL